MDLWVLVCVSLFLLVQNGKMYLLVLQHKDRYGAKSA